MLTVALPQASAQIANGTHSLTYQVNQPNSNSASIANDYFVKPAVATVSNGSAVVQLTLKNSSWITKFDPPGGAKVLNEDLKADTRVVEFNVSDISKPVIAAMKVDVEDINYHHEYSVSIVFEDNNSQVTPPATGNTTPPVTTPPTTTPSTTPKPGTSININTSGNITKPSTTTTQVANPQTSDSTPYLLMIALAGSAFLLYRTRLKTKQGEQ
ncbi:heme uptake protein IsdC [Sporosarcina sp. PTS2304]|nr:heme uptake protein IsdC [Sporosarcina sp. PTS2304]